jgi:hypothetical protein
MRWSGTLSGVDVPFRASWIAVIVAAALSFVALAPPCAAKRVANPAGPICCPPRVVRKRHALDFAALRVLLTSSISGSIEFRLS